MITSLDITIIIKKLTAFVLDNRRGTKAFKDWKESEIEQALRTSFYGGCMLYSEDGEGKVTGLVHGEAKVDEKLFVVSNILTTHPNAIKNFLITFDKMFPGFKLAGRRYGKMKSYKMNSFRRHLLKI